MFFMRNLILLLCSGLFMSFCSCKKETVEKVQTIRDTVYKHDTTTVPALISDTTTTFIILRHAEKEPTGTDPNLDTDGLLRAEELKRILGSVAIKAIYSTPFNRTHQTVQPLATAKSLSITDYQTATPYAQLFDEIRASWHGKVVVIIGHSNTVPEMLKELSKNTFNITISDSQYDNLFIVSLPDKLSATITHLKYGKETP